MEMITQEIKALLMNKANSNQEDNMALNSLKGNGRKNKDKMIKEYQGNLKTLFNPYKAMVKKGNKSKEVIKKVYLYSFFF